MRRAKQIAVIVFLFAVACHLSSRETPRTFEEIRSIVEGMARELPEDRTFYRWQRERDGRNLVRARVFKEKIFNHFMGRDSTEAAGNGLYVSGNPHSSRSYGDSLIQVEIAKGTRYIDLADPETSSALRRAGISNDDVYRANPKLVVRYSGEDDWWVVKAKEGVTFSRFTGEGSIGVT